MEQTNFSGVDEILPPSRRNVYFVGTEPDGSISLRIAGKQLFCDTEQDGEVLKTRIDEYIHHLNEDGITIDFWTLDRKDSNLLSREIENYIFVFNL